ncbi:DYNC2H1 isoform 3 [Pan troglodytes]|uniref:Cytoplasmic dynein 2 heavy chain 1 n=1 Tax=Pan troglodytes TaxID=9598 RepID=A0A2J8LBP4_PANTR|nr:DYNC2H1 isoform 3 [Pan troglodytes]
MANGTADVRKLFIFTTTQNYFGLMSELWDQPLLCNCLEINNFLDDGNQMLLRVQRSDAGISFSNTIEFGDTKDKVLVFFKLRPEVITDENLHDNILVSSMLESPISSLYQAVRQVFAPMLLKDQEWSRNFDPKLQNLLSELEAGLGIVLRRSDTNLTKLKFKEDDTRGILTPSDEFQFWIEQAHRGNKQISKERANYFKELFETIAREFYNLDSLSLLEVVDLVETTQDVVDDVWRQTEHDQYPESRMLHLLDIIGGSFGRFVQKKLGTLNLWEDPYYLVKESLKAGISICEQWVIVCNHLTGQVWQRYVPHPWKNEKYFPETLDKLGKRLEEVLAIRTIHEKFLYFLPASEEKIICLTRVFEPFTGLNPVQYNPYTEPLWKAAVSQYEKIIAPAEQKIAGKLKNYISEIQDSPQQLLQAFLKYKELVKRPTISKELMLERETLLARLVDSIKDFRLDFENRCRGIPGDASGPLSGKNLSEVVNNIVWVRQLELKVDDTIKIAEALLSDLSGFRCFHQSAEDLLDQLKLYEQEQFDDWSRDIQSGLSDSRSGLCIEASSRIMELDSKDGSLKVHYSDRLVILLREVRQLSALGFVIPAKIQQVANIAQKFCKQAIILKQVAHFYNSIDQQMIQSQRPMMLQSALAFEQIIKNSKTGSGGKSQITWDNPKELEGYIQKLQNAAERLATENRKLRKWHTTFCEKVVVLMNIDLLRQQQRWKDGLQELRTGLATVEAQGFQASDMHAWKQHWNHQLYKALEHQYQMGLEALNENLPEINIDLTYKQGRLQFRPPFEEIRAKYYREMKRFIGIPNQFKGVGEAGDESIFSIMIDRNASGFLTIFSKAEDLFRRLSAVLHQHKEWIVIGQVDMEALVEKHLFTVHDWEKNFKALKIKGKEVERLPSAVKVDCLNINCNPVKTVIDDLIQKLFDLLVLSLKKSIQAHLHEIDTFVTEAMEVLTIMPQSVEEIGDANLRYSKLQERKPEILPLFQEAEDKNRLLRTVAGGGLETISNLKAKWDKFELMMESHQLMIKDQIEVMKGNVKSRLQIYYQELEKFKARWDQLKPGDDVIETGQHNTLDKSAKLIKEKKIEFDDLEVTRKKLVDDCHHFRLEEPNFSLASSISKDIESCAQVWAFYEEFQQGFQEMANEDWITFRTKTYLFEEFLMNWHDRLRKVEEHSVMTVKLQSEVDKYKIVIPILKYVRGEHLSPDHWLDLFRLLGLPRGTSLEKLLFGDLLRVADTIVAKAADLKDLNSRAQGEVTIREALRELDLWGVGAVFTLIDYEDSQSRTMKLIKDWKDIVNQTWLNDLALEMKKTLEQLLKECVTTGRSSQGAVDPSLFPSQILCLAEQIKFTEDVENAIKDHSLHQIETQLVNKLEQYTNIDTSSEDPGNTESGILELKLKALILDIIHNIDVVKQLNQIQVHTTEDWAWKKQLRFYMKSDHTCCVQMVDSEFQYTYEYQGNASKLVYTPLTDKCYLTLTQAMKMGLGGNPYGPAGTGKTESVKALGGLLGRQVLVFNCDEGIDVKSMGRIFVGLVKCGAWGCFDEFNRLEESVLSAVSMQIQTIQDALKNHRTVCELLGKEVEVNSNSGIFITMNPAGKGYGGRQKLPDNLKQLFRPVAMSRPDNELIAEVILYSEGFKDAKVLGRKLVAIFNLSRELLTPQQHYDWGLRALKTVLRGSGNLLRQLKKSGTTQNANESHIVVQALRLNTMSKFTFTDCTRFDALIKDVFPGIELKEVEYDELSAALKQVFEEANYEIIPNQIKKALELYEQLCQRMGVVIVGPSGAGKSTLWRMLRAALCKTGKVVKQYTMNPKAMPRYQLLGHIDMDTREWSDGVLTNSARQVVREPQDVSSWIICDGDIDPEWIESLNSVLDDNRLLTMPSGERIQFGPNVNFVFETHDLSCASPATISRMGMIFLSDEETDLNSLIKSWLRNQPAEYRNNLENWIGDYFEKALQWVLKQNDYVVETSLVGTVMNGLSHLHGCRDHDEFIINLIRGLGGNLNMKSRLEFTKEVFHWARESPPDFHKPMDTYYDSTRGRLATYVLKKPENLTADDFSNGLTLPVIQTPDMQRGLDYFKPWLSSDTKQPFILVGPEGCGKGMLLRYAFSQLRSTQIATVHCSAQTTSRHLLQKLSQTCMVISTNTGRVYRPKDCERLVLYLKDINLPKLDKWGTSTLVAFLQQVLTYQGFYDENLEWVGLENIQIVASMSAGGRLGRHKLTTRFTSIVRLCSIDYPEREQLQTIYGAYLEPVLHKNLKNHSIWGSSSKIYLLAGSMVQVYEQVRAKFTVDDYSHYFFTPCILTQWVLGLFRYDLEGDYVLEIVAYEARRLFRDKIVGAKELHLFDIILTSVFQGDWGSDILDNMSDSFYVTWGARHNSGARAAPGQPLPPHGKPLGKLNSTDLKDVIKKGLIHYGRDNQNLDILLFHEVLEYISRIDRVLSFPGGSLLLAGRSGVGRRTITSLVSHMHGAVLFSPKISRGYELKQFKNDLKHVLQLAGIEAQQVVLLLEDYQFVHPTFLEMINSLLSSGEVPGLYTLEELEPLLLPLKDQASQDGFFGPVFNYFTYRIQQNLHIVLIMDSANSNFMINCESNPALHKKCQVLWMEGWSNSSMKKIPEMLFSETGGGEKYNDKKRKEEKKKNSVDPDFLKSFLLIHESCKAYGATPSRYMTFLHVYSAISSSKKKELLKRQSHLQAGVSKLNEAKALVDELNRKAGEQSVLLKTKQDEADAALQMITVSMQDASEQKTELERLKHRIAEEVVKIEERKNKIDDELKEVQNAKRASTAAAPLAAWVKANIQYSHVLERIHPLETEQAGLESNLKKTEDRKRKLEELLSSVGQKVSELKEKFQSRTSEAAKLEAEVSKAQETIKAAEVLINQLDREHKRWNAQSRVCPFLIDPSSQATEWLKTHLKDSCLEVINQQDSNFITALELAVRFGKTLIIQEMDGVEPVLYPLLRRDLVAQGPRYVVQIGDKIIDYNEEFRLFLSTRNPNPFIPPDAASIVTEVNFTTTRSGLRGQLLALTIQHEKPDLEEQKTKLLQQEEDKKIQLAKLEESLLEERDAYLPLAESASKMYFIISDLSKINNMYRFSLAAFLRLFQRALQNKQDSENTEQRIQSLISSLQHMVYEYICRCLFKADQLMFALHFVRGMHPELFQENEWDTFTGVVVGDMLRKADSQQKIRDQLPSWIDQERSWAVATLKIALPSLYQTLCFEDAALWRTYYNNSMCEQEFPSILAKKVSLFQQILVVQALRPDRLQSAMALFACKTLGLKEVSPLPLNLKRLYKETLEIEPILIIISPGADPSQELQELANAERSGECYHQVAMGQGQADLAIQMLKECARNGDWLCLKNLHLVVSWLPVLEKELNTLQPKDTFRLWLTAEVHPNFTPILLQSSLKITYESPPGLKKNLMRTYESWTPEQISKKDNIHRAHALFSLAWFHAACQERRNFIPQGWTKFYEFSLSDLRAGYNIIDRLFDGAKDVQWEFVHGLLENAIYGGRIDNYFDLRVLQSYLKQFFNSSVIDVFNQRNKKSIFPYSVSLPQSCSILDYRAVIEKIPEDDKPSFFGLPANIARSSQRMISSQVISQLRILGRSITAGSKFDREIWSNELSPVLNLWKKLNQNSNLIHQKVPPPNDRQGSPILSFIILEQFNAIRLVQSVHQSLAALSKVIRGTTLLSSEVQKLASALLNQKCPLAWQSKWEGPEDPLQYLRGLVARALAIQNWVDKAEKQALLSETLDLSELFHPDTFLNALRQETARAVGRSVDSLKFVASWKGRLQEAKLQIKISGLLLEGCSFDGNQLSENQLDSPSVSSVLPCFMGWIPQDACGPYSPDECISLPVYTSAERDRVVTNIDVPCGGNQDQWIQCGAALFLKNQ